MIFAYETCTVETSTLQQSNMTSWEIPTLNGGLNGKIIEVKLGPPKSYGETHHCPEKCHNLGMVCYYGCILYPQLDTQLYHWFYNYIYISCSTILHYIQKLYS